VGQSLHRLDLTNFTDSVIQLDDVQTVFALEYGSGSLWLADLPSSNAGVRLRAIGVDSWQFIDGATYELNDRVFDIDIDNGRLALAKGRAGIEVLDVGSSLNQPRAVLLEPTADTRFAQADNLRLSLAETEQVNSVQYFINNRLVGGSDKAPFATQLLVPANLRNGQPFTVQAAIETIGGQIERSQDREVLLQGENLPINNFRVNLVSPRVGQATFVPRPLEIRAEVVGSEQPIEQVEYFEADTPEGPYRAIGRHFGPEFVIFREYGVDDSGTYLRVRAIDIFGNSTQSQPIQFVRQSDNVQPQASAFSIDGPLLDNNEIVAQHDFVLSSQVQDAQSGIESAILRRNGLIVAAVFADGEIRHTETTAQVGQALTYELSLRDRAGNTNVVSQTYTIIEDTSPAIENFQVTSSPVLESGEFDVAFSATDQVSIERAQLIWNGFTTDVPVNLIGSGPVRINANATIRDQRAERINGVTMLPLSLRIYDDIGQLSEQIIDIDLQADLPPVADQLRLTYNDTNFYGNSLSVTIDQIDRANEGSDPVLIEIVEVAPQADRVVSSRATASDTRDMQILSFRLPNDDIDNDQYRFVVRITDHLGQSSQTEVQSIGLTRVPNELRFYKGADQAEFNPVAFSVDSSPIYQVEVVDAANRRIANQVVRFSLEPVAVLNATGNIDLGVATSDINGLASIQLNSAQRAGLYTLNAELAARSNIDTQRRVRIDTGETRILEVDFVESVEAGGVFDLNITAKDLGGNPTFSDSTTELTIDIPINGFNFGFTNTAEVTRLDSGGEQAIVTLNQGQAVVPVSAITEVGRYDLNFASDSSIQVFVSEPAGFVQRNTDDINVVAAQAFQVQFEHLSQNNHPLGDADLLEAGETATIAATLLDQYGNRVEQLNAVAGTQDANLAITISVDGDANVVEPIQTMSQGYVEFEITNNSAETNLVSVAEVRGVNNTAAPESLQVFGDLELEFLKRKPAIESIGFVKTINSQLTPIEMTFTEVIAANDETAPVVQVALNGQVVTGSFEVDNVDVDGQPKSRAIFTPESRPEFEACYDVSTIGTTWFGEAANDSVLEQDLQTCAFDAFVAVADSLAVLEGSTQQIVIESGFDTSPGDAGFSAGEYSLSRIISNSPLEIGETETFDINSQNLSSATLTFDVPTYSDQGLADGQTLALTIDALANPQRSFELGNALWYKVLQPGGDYDQDGLSNELEIQLPQYDPTLTDTDGNGIIDGDEDLDGDGLSNADEVAAGSDLTNGDSDGDGLSDFDEVNIHGSDPNNADTDNDGLSDFVEVTSESSPIDPFDTNVDPFFVTSIAVNPTSIERTLGVDALFEQLTTQAVYETQGRVEIIDISSLTNLLEYASLDTAIATTDATGGVNLLASGQTQIEVIFIENPNLNQLVDVTVEAQIISELPEEFAIVTPADGSVVVPNQADILFFINTNANRSVSIELSGLPSQVIPSIDQPLSVAEQALMISDYLDTIDLSRNHVALAVIDTVTGENEILQELTSDRAEIQSRLEELVLLDGFGFGQEMGLPQDLGNPDPSGGSFIASVMAQTSLEVLGAGRLDSSPIVISFDPFSHLALLAPFCINCGPSASVLSENLLIPDAVAGTVIPVDLGVALTFFGNRLEPAVDAGIHFNFILRNTEFASLPDVELADIFNQAELRLFGQSELGSLHLINSVAISPFELDPLLQDVGFSGFDNRLSQSVRLADLVIVDQSSELEMVNPIIKLFSRQAGCSQRLTI